MHIAEIFNVIVQIQQTFIESTRLMFSKTLLAHIHKNFPTMAYLGYMHT